jgi:hypothetical protein
VDNLMNFDRVQWRNANFELCDARTMGKFPDAQAQPEPLRSATHSYFRPQQKMSYREQ